MSSKKKERIQPPYTELPQVEDGCESCDLEESSCPGKTNSNEDENAQC